MAKNVDRQNGLHAAAGPQVAQFLAVPAAAIFEKIDDSRRTQLPIFWLCIDEDRPSANIANRVSWGDESEGGNKNFIVCLHARQQQSDVQGGGAVDSGDSILHPACSATHRLESVDIAANGGNPVGIETLLDVVPFIPANFGHYQGNEIRGRLLHAGDCLSAVFNFYTSGHRSCSMACCEPDERLPQFPGDGSRNAKAKLVRDAGERHPIVAWILLLVHVFHDSIGHMSTDHFDELLLLKVLIRCPDIEYGTGNLFGRRIEDKFNCAGRVSRMHIRAPELLAEYFEVLSWSTSPW